VTCVVENGALMLPALTILSIIAPRAWTHKGDRFRVNVDPHDQTAATGALDFKNRSHSHRRIL
jgi:hypothetical protein